MTNLEMANALRELRDFLIVAGYPELHATRYTHIATAVEHLGEPIVDTAVRGGLREIPGVGPLVERYMLEILATGRTTKIDEWREFAPWSVTELTKLPGLGARTVRKLWQEHGVDSVAKLREALDQGVLGPELAAKASRALDGA